MIASEKEFKRLSNFPGVIGALDGCHILIKAPNKNQRNYINKNRKHSVVLVVICDSDMKFIFINCGFPGSAHDTRVFNLTNLLPTIINSNSKYKGNFHTIGDSAFALSRHLLVPFIDYGNLSEKNFNSTLVYLKLEL